jgi:hypothetical protein
MDRTSSTNGKYEKFLQYFGRKTESKISLGRPRLRWENSIKTKSKATECEDIDLIKVAQEGA